MFKLSYLLAHFQFSLSSLLKHWAYTLQERQSLKYFVLFFVWARVLCRVVNNYWVWFSRARVQAGLAQAGWLIVSFQNNPLSKHMGPRWSTISRWTVWHLIYFIECFQYKTNYFRLSLSYEISQESWDRPKTDLHERERWRLRGLDSTL